MMEIKFSHNWNNKLTQDVFTAIRKYSESKLNYCQKCLDEDKIFDVVLNGEIISKVNLVSVLYYHYHTIPYALLAVDTGLTDIKEINKLFGTYSEVIVLTFKKCA